MIETIIFIIIIVCCCSSCCGSIGSILNSAGNLFNPSQWISTLSSGIPKLLNGGILSIGPNLASGIFKGGLGSAALGGVSDAGSSVGDAAESLNPF